MLLRGAPSKGDPRKAHVRRTVLDDPSEAELSAFRILQNEFATKPWPAHHDRNRQLYMDLDASKEAGFGAMVYHTTPGYSHDPQKPPASTAIQPVLFLSRCLSRAESNYWPTELEVACLVWVLRKVRHLVQAAPVDLPVIIYTDHSGTTAIADSASLRSVASDRLNLRLVRASQYIQQFRVKVFHPPGVTNKVADALSRLPSTDPTLADEDQDDLDALCVTPDQSDQHSSTIHISDEFRDRVRALYDADRRWSSVIKTITTPSDDPVQPVLPYEYEDGLLYQVDAEGTRSLCLPKSLAAEIFRLVHDEQAHQGLDRSWSKLRGLVFPRGLKLLHEYIKHCPQCMDNRTARHRPYGSLQPVLSPPVPFHTVTLDIVLGLPMSSDGFDAMMTVTDKFSKAVGLIAGKAKWDGKDWAWPLLTFFWMANWGLPAAIVSDRDPKFTQGLWSAIFSILISLLYSNTKVSSTIFRSSSPKR
ncbi:hypothetical protein N7532_002667 [Penicillium argentinense]|uniref:Integrase catalytic domain-containing protein n=1 Tax=Penicillium argentinense TaxID=1131581 RepID=A0A9W9G0X6_9EURO|nr:uncharacterized protein N7532_002667 [Penicillium argentinense]KAJ5110022.1 hypothetical protein N7532_002667 [Penicillium argentinense]